MRHGIGGRAEARHAASTRQMGRFETEVLTQPANPNTRVELVGRWIDVVRQRQLMRESTLDMGGLVSETCGRQEGVASVANDGRRSRTEHLLVRYLIWGV